jgi:hypothetical protein
MIPPLTPILSQHLPMYINVTECPTCQKKKSSLMLAVFDKSEVHSEGVLRANLFSKFFVTYPKYEARAHRSCCQDHVITHTTQNKNEVTQSAARGNTSRCTNCMSYCIQHNHSLISKINSSQHLYLFHIACTIYIIISIPIKCTLCSGQIIFMYISI